MAMEFTLKLTEADINAIGVAIGELPFKVAKPLLEKVQSQINEALTPKDKEQSDEVAGEKTER